MRRIRMESLKPDNMGPSQMVPFDHHATMIWKEGTTDCFCGHCEEPLLHNASDRCIDALAFRRPFCCGLSRYWVTQ